LKESGLSQRQFAKQEGVPASTLAYWLRRDELEEEICGETTLVAVSAASESTSGFVINVEGVCIELPRDTTVEEWRRLREAWAE